MSEMKTKVSNYSGIQFSDEDVRKIQINPDISNCRGENSSIKLFWIPMDRWRIQENPKNPDISNCRGEN